MSEMDNLCRRFLVSGRVQGVFYRASTLARAEELQLCGFVRNLSEGGVEVLACGEASKLTIFQHWLWQGPPQAQVNEVRVEAVDNPVGYVRFDVL